MAKTIIYTQKDLLKLRRDALARCGLSEAELHAKFVSPGGLSNREFEAIEALREIAFLLGEDHRKWAY